MLADISKVQKVYVACGKTDLRMSIDGLAAIVQKNFKLNPFENSVYLFCGNRKDRFKALYWEGDGFILLYKRLEQSKFQWPRTHEDVRLLSQQELRWLLEGLSIDQPKAVRQVEASIVI